MSRWVILATGPSMNKETAEYVRGKAKVIAVSDAFRLAPWADALVSHDAKWWKHHKKEALKFEGKKFCRFIVGGTILFNQGVPSQCNSGYYAMNIAKSEEHWGDKAATEIILLGFDMHGSHYFGKHPEPLGNTTKQKRSRHMAQFSYWTGCPVINCTPDSRLETFPKARIQDIM